MRGSGEVSPSSLRTPLLDASIMMKSADPRSSDLRREFTRREHGAAALVLLWLLCVLAFMRLHSAKADASSEVGMSWSLVFAPLLGMSVVSLAALLLSPLLLPREQRLATEEMINGCLLALAVGSLARFACGRLDPPPAGGFAPPAVPSLLPLAALWLHAGARSVRRLGRASRDQPGGRVLAVALVVGTYSAYGASLWLLRWRLEALEAAPGNSSLARLSGTDAPPVAVSWWLVAAPLLLLQAARLLLACGGCVVVARGQPPPAAMARGGADECDWRIAWEGAALSSSCGRLCSSLLLLVGLCTLAARLEAVAPADGAAAAGGGRGSGTWGGAYLPFALLLLLPLCCCGCCALCVCVLAPGGTPAAATGGGGGPSKPRDDSGRGSGGASAGSGKGVAGAVGGATETSARQCARRGRAHSGKDRPAAAEDEEAGGAPLLPGACPPSPLASRHLPARASVRHTRLSLIPFTAVPRARGRRGGKIRRPAQHVQLNCPGSRVRLCTLFSRRCVVWFSNYDVYSGFSCLLIASSRVVRANRCRDVGARVIRVLATGTAPPRTEHHAVERVERHAQLPSRRPLPLRRRP